MNFKTALAFTVVVTLAMQTLDIMYHDLTGIAVHFPYIAVKTTVVGFMLFWVTYLMGVNWKDGLIGSLLGTTLFDIYYRFAEATLDRSVFKLDEKSVFFILLHFVCLIIPYTITQKYILQRSLPGRALATKTLSWMMGIGFPLAAVFILPDRKWVKAQGLTLGLTHNDQILIGTLLLIVALAALYKMVRMKYPTKLTIS